VGKVQSDDRGTRAPGHDVVLIGHAGHDEVVGTLGQTDGVQLVEAASDVAEVVAAQPDQVACVSQTTLRPQDVGPIVDALRRRFPALAEPARADICYATSNRQAAIEWLARQVDVVLVVGDPTSSNSQRLREAAAAAGCVAHLIRTATEIDDAWLADADVVGVSAGASTPDDLVSAVVERLCRDGADLHEEAFLTEQIVFRLPKGLAAPAEGAGSGQGLDKATRYQAV
jgi:4-hydroxy-3-methylbut-2-enyl diphosphate reductase